MLIVNQEDRQAEQDANLLEQLERRHDEVLVQIDALVHRIEDVLQQFKPSKLVAANEMKREEAA